MLLIAIHSQKYLFETIFIDIVDEKQENPTMPPIQLDSQQPPGGEVCVLPIDNPNGLLGAAEPSRYMHIENSVVNSTVSDDDSLHLSSWSSIPLELSSTTARALLPILREIEEEEAEEQRRVEQRRVEQREAPQ